MKTPIGSILCFAVSAQLGAVGQLLNKSGADKSDGTLLGYLANWRIVSGVICYIAVMVLFVAAFKRGGSLAVLYPIHASTFIFAAIIGLLAYQTPIKPINIAGMAMLVGGMYLMGR